jgi:hypothetical protein
LAVRFIEESFSDIKYPACDRVDFKPRKDYPESILDKNPCLDDMIVNNIPSFDDLVDAVEGNTDGQ